jgi:hypothetical protein
MDYEEKVSYHGNYNCRCCLSGHRSFLGNANADSYAKPCSYAFTDSYFNPDSTTRSHCYTYANTNNTCSYALTHSNSDTRPHSNANPYRYTDTNSYWSHSNPNSNTYTNANTFATSYSYGNSFTANAFAYT